MTVKIIRILFWLMKILAGTSVGGLFIGIIGFTPLYSLPTGYWKWTGIILFITIVYTVLFLGYYIGVSKGL